MDLDRVWRLSDLSSILAARGPSLSWPGTGEKTVILSPRQYPGVSKEADRSLIDVYSNESPEGGSTLISPDQVQASASPDHMEDLSGVLAAAVRSIDTQENSNHDISERSHSIFMQLDESGATQHKKTILREVMDETDDIDYQKTHDRLLRIKCFSIGGDHWDRKGGLKQGADLPPEERFEIGHLFATLIRVRSEEVSLGIAQCTGIKSGTATTPISLACAPRAEITLPSSQYTLSGQILSIAAFSQTESQDLWWAWDANFLSFEALKKKQSKTPRPDAKPTSKGELVFNVPAALVIPLAVDEHVQVSELVDLPESIQSQMHRRFETTWIFPDRVLSNLRDTLWSRVKDSDSTSQTAIPTYGTVIKGSFPYQTSTHTTNGEIADVCHLAGRLKAKVAKAEERLPCRICGILILGTERQNHVGAHIRLAIDGRDDPSATIRAVSSSFPCGFCGGLSTTDGKDGSCSVGFGPRKTALSTCVQSYPFGVTSASKSSKAKPCTNVPVRCALCPAAHWKYNMPQHLSEQHPSWKSQISREFTQMITVTDEEKERLTAIVINNHRAIDNDYSSVSDDDTSCSEESDLDIIDPIHEKRPASSPPGSPSTKRREQDGQPRKLPRVILKLPPDPFAQ